MSAATRQAVAEADAEANAEVYEQAYAAPVDDETDDFDPGTLAAPLVLPASLADNVAPKNARSEAQMAIDSVVADVHAKWAEAGEPRTWPEIVATGSVAGYWVKPVSVERVKKMIKAGADYHKRAVRYGRVAPRTEEMEQDGRVFVSFAILTRRTRASAL